MIVGAGCRTDARLIWKKAIQRCANNDLLGPDVVYLGPSTQGPGTVFIQYRSGGIGYSHLASEYMSANNNAIIQDAEISCGADSATSNKVSASLDLSKVLSVPVNLSAKLSSAKTISFKTDSMKWVSLVDGPYKAIVNGLPENSQVKADLIGGKRLVLSRALLIKGMTAKLEFSKEAALDVRASLPTGATTSTNANTDASFSADWAGDTTLVLTSKEDFYIGGELRHYDIGGLSAAEIGEKVPNAAKLKLVAQPQ